MPYDYFKTEKELEDRFYVFSTLLKRYVDVISGNDRWFFDICYQTDYDAKAFNISYRSYETPEYKKFMLSIIAKKQNDGNYKFSVYKRITDLA